MCCFSGPVLSVESTRIFARPLEGALQALVYEAKVAAGAPVAMVLPLPVPEGAGDGAVRFVSLEGCPRFFAQLAQAFAPPRGPPSRGLPRPAALEVHEVGDFVASWVPTAADFARLDPRFRLAPEVLAALPQYRTFGFAVFQLAAAAEGRTIHPMALVFPRRDPSSLFFPTFHVHDGAVHERASFDHELYLQGAAPAGWERAGRRAGDVLDLPATAGLVDAEAPLAWRSIHGERANEDVVVPLA